jgi:hypothetical protein
MCEMTGLMESHTHPDRTTAGAVLFCSKRLLKHGPSLHMHIISHIGWGALNDKITASTVYNGRLPTAAAAMTQKASAGCFASGWGTLQCMAR